ncbi:MAG: SpaA isopeptide-forming pilin-related protein [Erysipelotrichales bacterium]
MKKIKMIIFSFLFIVLFNVSVISAATIVATDKADLIDKINNATDGTIIELDSNFNADSSMTLPTPNVKVIVDGKGIDLGQYRLDVNGGPQGGELILQNFKLSAANSSAMSIGSTGKVTLDNFIIKDRKAGGNGTAISLVGNAGTFTLKNSTIANNIHSGNGYTGAGLFTDGYTGAINIENNNFLNNKNLTVGNDKGNFGGQGGALLLRRTSGKINIKNNVFDKNEAVYNNEDAGVLPDLADGGAIALFDIKSGSNIKIDGNTFSENKAGADGGAMLIQFADALPEGSVVLNNNTFYKNIAKSYGVTEGNGTSSANSGGAIQIYQVGGFKESKKSTTVFTNNTFVDSEVGTSGGAIASSHGGIFNSAEMAGEQNLFVENKKNGGANDNLSTASLSGNLLSGSTNMLDTNITSKDVFGFAKDDISLVNNNTTIEAGDMANRVKVKTLQTNISSSAFKKAGASKIATDQRAFNRDATNSDYGATETAGIKYLGNGGTWNKANAAKYNNEFYYVGTSTTEYYQNAFKLNGVLNIMNDTDLGRSGYTFNGWNTKADGSGDKYVVNSEYTANTKDLVLYAQWTQNTKKGMLRISNIDALNPRAQVGNAEFAIYNLNGEVVEEGVKTNKKGKVDVILPVGQYTVKQTKASNGYELITKTYSISIEADGWYELIVHSIEM